MTGKQPANRRSLLRRLSFGAALGALGGHLLAGARALVPNVRYEPPSKRRLGPAEQFPKGRTYLPDLKIFVLRDKQGMRVLSGVCPHLGCTVGGSDKGFHCPCHGSKFDENGINTAGPAPRPLAWHPLSVRGGALIVDLGSETDATRFLDPATGEVAK